MKYKLIGAGVCLAAIAVSVAVPVFWARNDELGRYHQHISATLRPEDEVDDGTFNTHLPLVILDTGGTSIPGTYATVDNFDPELLEAFTVKNKKIYDKNGGHVYIQAEDGESTILAHMDVVDNQTVVNRPEDTPAVSSDICIRVRGRSSRSFEKNSYAIKLIDENGKNNPQELMGMDSHHEWALYGPYLDKTLLRNYMWYNIAGEIMDYAPNVRFCEVILNGEYRGVYVMVETITAGKKGSRLNMTVNAKRNTFSGYLLRLDTENKYEIADIDTFTKYTMRTKHQLEIKYPGSSNLTPKIAEEIRQDFSAFEKSLYSYDFDNKKFGYRDYIDSKSFADYFILNEFTCNYDAGWLSTYVYKGTDSRFRTCIWDFNSACENYRHLTTDPMDFQMQNCLWFFMLMKDEAFTQEIVDEYRYLRTNWLSDEYLTNYVQEVIDYLGPAIDRNYQVWGYTYGTDYDMLVPTERNPRNYTQAVDDMMTFLQTRPVWMDENIESVLQYSQESRIKKFNENAN